MLLKASRGIIERVFKLEPIDVLARRSAETMTIERTR